MPLFAIRTWEVAISSILLASYSKSITHGSNDGVAIGILNEVLDLARRGLLEAVATDEVRGLRGQVMASLP
jgi:hypothetical protein